MLTRRQLLIAAAVSPIAQFCRPEPVGATDVIRLPAGDRRRINEIIAFLESKPAPRDLIAALDEAVEIYGQKSSITGWLYALPPGTLG